MYHEATVKFRVNTDNEDAAKNIAQCVINYFKEELGDSAIVFVDNFELINIEPVGIDCYECKYHQAEEEIIGDRGHGVESVVRRYCSKTGDMLHFPSQIDYCDDYEDGG